MAFGIQDLERDVQKFQKDIEKAKVKYLAEYVEYMDITTQLENVAQKYDFLEEEVVFMEQTFSEEREGTLSNLTKGLLISGGVSLSVGLLINRIMVSKLSKATINVATATEALLDARRAADAAAIPLRGANTKAVEVLRTTRNTALNIEKRRQARIMQRLVELKKQKLTSKLAGVSKVLKLEKAKKARLAVSAKLAKFTAGAGAILSIVGIAFTINDIVQRKKYLEGQSKELKRHLDDVNTYIAEANGDTKTVIDVFLTYFSEFEVDVDGVFNNNGDGFLNKSGQQKFDDAVSQLRAALNGTLKKIGELSTATQLAKKRIDRYILRDYKGKDLIEETIFDTALSEEIIQHLYLLKLRETDHLAKEAIALSDLSADLVNEVYARGYLDEGQTVEDIISLFGLPEEHVRMAYAGKLLDELPDIVDPEDVFGIKRVAKAAGVSEDVVLEMQFQKISDISLPLEEDGILEAEES